MSTLRNDLWPLALHEAGHVLASFFANHTVEKVFVGRPKGYAVVIYPMNPESLATRWAESPIVAAGNLMRIVGAIRSGALFEGAVDLYGDDLQSMAQWRDAYVAGVGTPQDWNNTYAEVYTNLLSWRQRASVQAAVKTIAQGLLWEGTTSREALMNILASAQVQLIPEPYYQPLLPSPQRSPAPVVSMSGQRRVAGQVGVDLKRFARDAHGRIRPLTQAEWRYIKSHDIEAIAHNFTDAEMEVLLAYMEDDVARQQGKSLARR